MSSEPELNFLHLPVRKVSIMFQHEPKTRPNWHFRTTYIRDYEVIKRIEFDRSNRLAWMTIQKKEILDIQE